MKIKVLLPILLTLALVTLAGLGGLYALHALLLLRAHVWLGWLAPGLFVGVAAALLASLEYARTRWERERVYQNLSSYLPQAVAARVAYQSRSSRVEAGHRDVTVLFADLRNFSAFCKARPAEESATVLHVFFTTVAEVVAAHGGVVEHLVGDGIMAVWNGAVPCSDPEEKTLAAARELWVRAVAALPALERFGLEPLDLGIGVESGVALVGTFGPAGRRTHTVMGEPVSVASRLQAMTADLAAPVLVGEACARRVGIQLQDLGAFLLEGMTQERHVFALAVPLEDAGRAPLLQSLRLVGTQVA